jgi:DNA-binding NarL/FixJ family response regulator
LREILASKLGAELEVTEAQNAPETVNLLLKEDWDLVLLDINMPGGSGLEVLEQASKIRPKTPILVLTCFPEEQFAVRAFKLGASGYLTKQSASDELITAIRRILAGGKYVTATLGERLAASLGSPAEEAIHETLSQRELEVLRLVAVGKSTKEIADGLSLSDKTVMTYRTRIWEKTGLKTSVDIARYALKNGIVE